MAPLSTFTCIGLLFWMQCELPPAPETTTVVCPPVIEMPVAQQKRIGKRLAELNDPDLTALAQRFVEQRNVNRRCRSTKKGSKQ